LDRLASSSPSYKRAGRGIFHTSSPFASFSDLEYAERAAIKSGTIAKAVKEWPVLVELTEDILAIRTHIVVAAQGSNFTRKIDAGSSLSHVH
jgi:hypothetical protein